MNRALTLDNVLSRINQKEVMERFFGDTIIIGRKYRNPFRVDNTPNCWFNYDRGILMFYDFASPFFGDAAAICSYRLGTSLYPALQFLNKEYNLGLGYDDVDEVVHTLPIRSIIQRPNEKYNSKIVFQRYEDFDEKDYFFDFHIKKSTLELFDVYPCHKVWVQGAHRTEVFRYEPTQPLYIYDFGEDRYKMYRPKSPTSQKWRCNTDCVQGDKQLTNKEELIIRTSSLKDVMVLYECGFQADAPQSENQLACNRTNMILLYDNDTAGITNMQRHSQYYNCPYIVIPKLGDKLLKDISDVAREYGLEFTTNLIKELLCKPIVSCSNELELVGMNS